MVSHLRIVGPHRAEVVKFAAVRSQRQYPGVKRHETPSLGTAQRRGLIEVAPARCGRPRSEVETEIEERLRTYESAAGDRRDVAAGEEGGRKGVRNRVRRGR